MTKDEALKLALEALEDLGMKHFENTGEVLYKETFTAIKEALAQTEQGQFALKHRIAELEGAVIGLQAQRTWVGLTDEEVNKIRWDWVDSAGDYIDLAQAIEAKLKEKNEQQTQQ